MITKLFTLFSSLLASASVLFGSAFNLPLEAQQALPEEAPLSSPSSPDFLLYDGLFGDEMLLYGVNVSPGIPQFLPEDRLLGGDPFVRAGLIMALVRIADLSPVEVLQGLGEGESIASLAESSGKTADDVLAVYDETVEYVFTRAVEQRGLPQSLTDSRIAWYQEVGRMMVDQPGLQPPFPGLHQLHIAILFAAAKVGELKRWEIQDGLHDCRSLEELLEEKGHSGQEAVDLAAERIGARLDQAVKKGKLTPEQRDEWLASLIAALETMAATPGLHLAGRECAQ